MNENENRKSGPMRELEWLAQFFHRHGQEDLAQQIRTKVIDIRSRTYGKKDLDESRVGDLMQFFDDEEKVG